MGSRLVFSADDGAHGAELWVTDGTAAGTRMVQDSVSGRDGAAPNGRLLIYATKVQGRSVLMTTTLDGKIKARLPSATADLREPVWGPFGR